MVGKRYLLNTGIVCLLYVDGSVDGIRGKVWTDEETGKK
jgi:hypothetical protein